MIFRTFLSVALLFLSIHLSLAQNSDSGLAPTVQPAIEEGIYTVSIKEVNKTGVVEELSGTVSLEDGTITSSFSERNGFPEAPYNANVELNGTQETISFSAESPKSDGEVLTWEGTIVGTKISGKAYRNRTGTTYYFEGKRK